MNLLKSRTAHAAYKSPSKLHINMLFAVSNRSKIQDKCCQKGNADTSHGGGQGLYLKYVSWLESDFRTISTVTYCYSNKD